MTDLVHQQTWDEFITTIKNREVIIYGVGAIAGFICLRCDYYPRIRAIVDNDKKKWGNSGNQYIYHEKDNEVSFPIIQSPSILDTIDREEVVLVIASNKGYLEISMQLEKMGFSHIFSIPLMERNLGLDKGQEYTGNNSADFLSYLLKMPIENNKIIYVGFGTYSDHGKYIIEQLLELSQEKDIIIECGVYDRNHMLPADVTPVYMDNRWVYYRELMTAKIVIYNTVLPTSIKKRSGQIHIHTKHWASITLKRFYLDATTLADDEPEIKRWKTCFSDLDYVITGSKFDEESVRRGFDFKKDIVDIGSPRSDAMFHRERYKHKICTELDIDINAKLVLYAPTYRYETQDNKLHVPVRRLPVLCYFDVMESLSKRWGGEWVLLLRLHPSIRNEVQIEELGDSVINVSMYEDGEELASACDVMITDYSSIMFEPAFVGKPVFLFAPDREDYIDEEYDLLIDYDSLPFPIAESNEELMHLIQSFDAAIYEKKVVDFMEIYGVNEDGHASERAAEFVLNLL